MWFLCLSLKLGRRKEDIKTAGRYKNSDTVKNVFISADKSTNIYAMEKDDYNRYLRKNITKTYKKQREEKLSQGIMKRKKL